MVAVDPHDPSERSAHDEDEDQQYVPSLRAPQRYAVRYDCSFSRVLVDGFFSFFLSLSTENMD